MDCKHVFVGKADGVHCKKCGLHMTPKEYRDYVEEAKKAQEQKEEASAEPEKPKRSRKKKEEADNE